tara:strand:+ start:1300 stop:1455 length:156 start_codon:yes stop_codon:yes gene_type:complete
MAIFMDVITEKVIIIETIIAVCMTSMLRVSSLIVMHPALTLIALIATTIRR